MDIQKMYDNERHSTQIMEIKNLEKNLRLYVNGGFDGLRDIYYNYHQEQKIKFSEITPFETFIDTDDVVEFYLNEVFFEVDNNKYTTNIGCFISSLCNYYINSDKNIENKKVDLISIVTRLEQAINKSAISQFDENPKLYDVLKRIENYYRIAYSGLYEDFSPFLTDRPQNKELCIKTNENTGLINNVFGTQEISLSISEKTILDRSEIINSLIGLKTKKHEKFLEYEKKLVSLGYLNSARNKWLKGAANFIRFYVYCENKSIIKNDIYQETAKGVKLLRDLYDYHTSVNLDSPSKRAKQMTKRDKTEFNFLDII